VLGEQEIGLELLPGHQIGAGRHIDRQNWYVTDTPNGLELVIHDSGRVTYRMQPASNGAWVGERLATPRNEVRLDERSIRQATEHLAGFKGLVESLVGASGLHAENSEAARNDLRFALRLLLRAEPTARAALLDLADRSPGLAGMVQGLIENHDRQRPRPITPPPELFDTGYDRLGEPNR